MTIYPLDFPEVFTKPQSMHKKNYSKLGTFVAIKYACIVYPACYSYCLMQAAIKIISCYRT